MCVEVMDAHLQNNQTAEHDILASPDRLKGRKHSHIQHTHTIYIILSYYILIIVIFKVYIHTGKIAKLCCMVTSIVLEGADK